MLLRHLFPRSWMLCTIMLVTVLAYCSSRHIFACISVLLWEQTYYIVGKIHFGCEVVSSQHQVAYISMRVGKERPFGFGWCVGIKAIFKGFYVRFVFSDSFFARRYVFLVPKLSLKLICYRSTTNNILVATTYKKTVTIFFLKSLNQTKCSCMKFLKLS